MTPADRKFARRHIQKLARRHRIRVHWTKGRYTAEANHRTRQAWVPRSMRAPIDYATALHELGHIVSRRAQKNRTEDLQGELIKEAAAWAWALEHGAPEILDQMRTRDWLILGSMWASYGKAAVRAAAQARSMAER